MSPEWTTISKVSPGDQIPFIPRTAIPALRADPLGLTDWRTVIHIEGDGRSRILTFSDGTTFDAGHAYRLWVRRG